MEKTVQWKNDKAFIAELFKVGLEELKEQEPSALQGYDTGALQIQCSTAPVSWDDSDRVAGSVYAVGAMVDNRPVNLALLKDANFDYGTLVDGQPMSFSQDDRFNAVLLNNIKAGSILVNIKQGAKGRERELGLFTPEFTKAWAENYHMAGGTIKDFAGDDRFSNTMQWSALFKSAGLNEYSDIPVYYRIYACSPNTEFAMWSKSYGHKLVVWTWTSSGHFSMSCMNTDCSGLETVRECCSGVWKMNESGKLDICGVKMTASDEGFSVEELETMMQVDPTEQGQGNAPSKALFPFAGNETLEGCWIAQLSFPLQEVRYRGFGGATRGLSFKPSVKPEFYFPKMEPGEKIRPMTDMPELEKGKKTLLKPTLTISSIIVQDSNNQGGYVPISIDEKKTRGVALASAVIKQFRDMHTMAEKCANAYACGIQDSGHALDKAALNPEQKEILDSRVNAAFFDVR